MPLMQPPEALASCERSLRELLTIALRAKFGEAWISEVFTDEDVERLEQKRSTEEKRRTKRGVAAVPASLINYAEFTQLTRLVGTYWDSLGGALGAKKEMTVLLDRFEALRNSVAHSRELLPFEQELLSAIAGEIRNRVTIHISGQDPAGNYFPRVELVRDSLGNSTDTASRTQEQMLDVETQVTLRPGDVVKFTCRGVDPQGRLLTWLLQTPDGLRYPGPDDGGDDVELIWNVEPQHVHARASVLVILASDGQYHRFGTAGFDATVSFRYEVLPPLD